MFYKNILLQTISEKVNSKNTSIISEGVKEMKQKYLKQGIDSNIIDSYLERYKNIKASKYLKDEIQINVQPNDRNNIDKFKDFHDLEVLVDYVENKINLDKQDKTLKKSYRSDNEIETDGEPVYKDSELEILYADSPRACIKYKGDFPYNWCVSADTGGNMYSTYRFKEQEPAFYFVKQLKKIDKELNENPDFPTEILDKYHFFVIQVFKNVKMGDLNSKYYYVTSALNDGDVQMSWNEIIEKAPILKGKQEFFKDVPHSETEKADYQRFKNGIDDEEFKGLSVEEKRKYLDIYVSQEKLLSDEQFFSMPKSLKKLYIGFGVPISEEQLEYIKNNADLLKYYNIVLKRRLEKSDEGVNVRFKVNEVLYVYENQLGSDKFYVRYVMVLLKNNIQPSENIQLEAVKKYGFAIEYIKNPSEEVKLAAVEENGFVIEYIENPSEKVQLAAVKQSSYAIEYIENPNEKTQLEVIKKNSARIKNINYPTEKAQILAVKKNSTLIEYIKNPSEKAQFIVCEEKDSLIFEIQKPTELIQLYVLNKLYNRNLKYANDSVKREIFIKSLSYLYNSLKNKNITTPKVDRLYNYMVKKLDTNN
jgi:hypothetical protein